MKEINKFVSMKEIIVIGHKNPDTDTVVSAILLAELINKTQKPVKGRAVAGVEKELNRETKFVLEYFNQEAPEKIESLSGKDVFLVDHGEFEQSPEGIESANLVGVLDHHKMGGIKTNSPIYYRAETKGSTCTIIAEMFFQNNVSVEKKEAGLLLSAIISDTLNLTSPTTTQEDKDVADKLIEISKENMDKLAEKMFEAKSDISGISAKELVTKDYKEYEAGGKKFSIGIWETVKPERVEEIQKDIFSSLEEVKKENSLDFVFFGLVDILKNETKMFLLEEEKKIAQAAFEKDLEGDFLVLPGVVSRKKQILPAIINFLERK